MEPVTGFDKRSAHVASPGTSEVVETEDGVLLLDVVSPVATMSEDGGRAAALTSPLYRGWQYNAYNLWWRPRVVVEMTEEQARRLTYEAYIMTMSDGDPVPVASADRKFGYDDMVVMSGVQPLLSGTKVYCLKTSGFTFPPALCYNMFGVWFSTRVCSPDGNHYDGQLTNGQTVATIDRNGVFDGCLAYGKWYGEHVLDPPSVIHPDTATWFDPKPFQDMLDSFSVDDLSFMDDCGYQTFDVDGHEVTLVADSYDATRTDATTITGRLVGWPREERPDGLRLSCGAFSSSKVVNAALAVDELSEPHDGTVTFKGSGWPVETWSPGRSVLVVDGKEVTSTEGRVGRFVLDALRTQPSPGDGYTDSGTDIGAIDWPGHARALGTMMAAVYKATKNFKK